MTWVILLLVGFALFVGYQLGQTFGASSRRAAEFASNLTIASFVVTMDDTYGEVFRRDFIEAVNETIETEKKQIALLVLAMEKEQAKP